MLCISADDALIYPCSAFIMTLRDTCPVMRAGRKVTVIAKIWYENIAGFLYSFVWISIYNLPLFHFVLGLRINIIYYCCSMKVAFAILCFVFQTRSI